SPARYAAALSERERSACPVELPCTGGRLPVHGAESVLLDVTVLFHEGLDVTLGFVHGRIGGLFPCDDRLHCHPEPVTHLSPVREAWAIVGIGNLQRLAEHVHPSTLAHVFGALSQLQ